MGSALQRLKRAMLVVVAALARRLGVTKLIDLAAGRVELRRSGEELRFPFLRRRRSRALHILLYHRVSDDDDPFLQATPIRTFAGHMEYLASRCTVLPLETSVEALLADDLPDRAVTVTFDDGYRDNFVHALPVLRACSLPATVFLATGAIGTGRVLWHDRVCRAIRETGKTGIRGFGPGITRPLREDPDRRIAQQEILLFLRSLDDAAREEAVEELLRVLEVEDSGGRPGLMLDWDDAREMSRHGVSFGSHTVTHPVLSRVDERRAWREIHDSKITIERELGTPVSAFAYPSGRVQDFDASTKSLVRKAGYTCAVTTIVGPNGRGAGPIDALELRRGGSWEPDVDLFALRLSVSNLLC